MHPAFSILFFTTLAGAGQGMVVALALALLAGTVSPGTSPWMVATLLLALLLLLGGLVSSFFHLGHKGRAWRAVLMWRTSWMSREVIVLPVFIALVAAWALATLQGWALARSPWMALVAVALSMLLWVCTAMIYACLRFVQEWASPLTVSNFVLIGLSSGTVLACALAAIAGEAAALTLLKPYALLFTVAAWWSRHRSLRRNASLVLASTAQSATGIHAPRLVQKSMGMMGGSFNTREFFHGFSNPTVQQVRWFFPLALFAAPTVLAAVALGNDAPWPWLLAVFLQAPGMLAERWFFFVQARHPQNLYYQSVA